MKINLLLGIGLGGVAIVAIAKAINNSPTRQIHLSQTQIANNAGLVFYEDAYYSIEEVLAQTSDLQISAYEAQQEIASNSQTGGIIEMSIKQIGRLTGSKLIEP